MAKAAMKKWKSIDEQIKILQSRSMMITDLSKAADQLRRIGYYRLSGYSYSFRKMNKNYPFKNKEAQKTTKQRRRVDQFVPNTRLSEVVDIYVFDKQLKILCCDAIERIEVAIRVDVAYELGQLDPIAHTLKEHLDEVVADKIPKHKKVTNYADWLENYERLKQRSANSEFVMHNIKDYGELPIWAATEIFDFGTLSKLFEMLKLKQRNAIARKYGLPDGKHLKQWLRSLCYIRNSSAHHERLWNMKIKTTSSVPVHKGCRHMTDIAKTDQYRLFRYLCIMQFLLETICPNSQWGTRMQEHLKGFPTPRNREVTLSALGVVRRWEKWPLWNSGE